METVASRRRDGFVLPGFDVRFSERGESKSRKDLDRIYHPRMKGESEDWSDEDTTSESSTSESSSVSSSEEEESEEGDEGKRIRTAMTRKRWVEEVWKLAGGGEEESKCCKISEKESEGRQRKKKKGR